jgi:hypothetical protein
MSRVFTIGIVLLLAMESDSRAETAYGTWDYGAMTCSGAPESACGDGMSADLGSSGSGTISRCSSGATVAAPPLDSLSFAELPVLPAPDGLTTVVQNTSFQRINLKERPAWSNSAAWAPDGASLIVADTKRKVLMKFGLDGRLLQTVTALGSDLNLIQGTVSGYLVEARDGGFVWLDAKFSSQKTLDVKAETSDKPTKVTSVFGWLASGDNLLTFGDFEQEGRSQSSLMKISHHSPLAAEPIMPVGPNARRFFLLGYPLLASADNKGYALLLEESSRIVEVGLDVRELRSFPPDYRIAPSLPTRPANAAEAFGPIERAKTAISLLGWRDTLYLLTRKPLSGGQTEWTLWPIKPREDHLLAGKVLPTQAAHILVVPGPKKWAILEKGPVLPNGSQDIASMLLIEPKAMGAAFDVWDQPAFFEAP